MYTVGHSRIVGTGVYVPEDRISSRDIMQELKSQERLGISYDWLERTTGIKERRVAAPDMLPSDMAALAAREALERANVAPDQIDAIIYVGFSRDRLEPATAHIVQHKVQAYNAVAFDISNACHGFMNGIHMMDALIATGQARRGLVVTGEQGSRVTKMTMRTIMAEENRDKFNLLAGGLTLGDAGAAMIMGPKLQPDTGFAGFMLQSRGDLSHLCVCGDRGQETALYTDMPTIVSHNKRLHSAMFKVFMEKLGWAASDIARFVHHQVGIRIFKQHAEYSGIPVDLMPNTLTMYGNMISANIPFNLYRLEHNREVTINAKIFLSGSGSGLAISQAGLVWEAA